MINKNTFKETGRCFGVTSGRGGRAGRAFARMRSVACREAEAEARVSSGAMAAGGLSRSERKAAERVREVARGATERAPPPGTPPPAPRRVPSPRRPHRPPQVPAGVAVLRKAATERSAEEGRLLAESRTLVTELQGRSRRREAGPEAAAGGGKSWARAGWAGTRRWAGAGHTSAPVSWQVCDDPEELQRKVRELASAVRTPNYSVVYTGAGISTVDLRAGTTAPGSAPRSWENTDC